MRVLWVTNDLPPRHGGIQQFVQNLLVRVHPDDTVVIAPKQDDDEAFDAEQPYETVRAPLLGGVQPTPAVRRLVREVGSAHRPDVVVLGASWPLGELAGAFRDDLGVPVVALSHGHEAGLVTVGAGHLVRRATADLAALTTISDWCEERLRRVVDGPLIRRVPPGVDVDLFTPDIDGTRLRRQWGVPDDAPLVTCISRLVARKGQDVLIDAWPRVRERHPTAWLAIVGSGPDEDDLREAAEALGPDAGVIVTGGVPWEDLPAAYAAGDLFVMPCRTRRLGTDVEGLGIVFLEAAACGKAVVAGDSGGAPETVQDGITGSVVDGRRPAQIVEAIDRWLSDPQGRRRAGAAGRQWAVSTWSWDAIAARFVDVLDEVVDAG